MAWKIFAVASVTVLGVAAVFPSSRTEVEIYQAEMEAKLEEAWQTRHPGPSLPEACEHDEIRSGEMDIDESPGRELVIASERLGIAMFAESGELLAMADPKGCRAEKIHWWFNNQLGGATELQGVVLREGFGGCRSGTWVTALHRRGDTLETLARYREQDSDQCRWNGTSGPTVNREVTRVEVPRDGYGRPMVKFHVVERCTECENERVHYDCTMRGPWISGECAQLVQE